VGERGWEDMAGEHDRLVGVEGWENERKR